MAKKFIFVSGDTDGANYQLPVIRKLVQLGHDVHVLTDPSGRGGDVFNESGISFQNKIRQDQFSLLASDADLFWVNACASASDLGINVLYWISQERISRGAKIVMGSDGLFNYGFSKWWSATTNAKACGANVSWLAIDAGHAIAIAESWKRNKINLDPSSVIVVGQPAFDSVLDYIPRKQEVRNLVRKELGLNDSSTLLLWWSQGMLDVISEDVCMLLHGLERFRNSRSNIFLAPRIHPKLNKTVGEGYADEIKRLLYFSTSGSRLHVIDADSVKAEELCLAADVILSITCTEDVKTVMMGGPPVVHLLGPLARRWLENDLGQTSPYLPDVKTGRSLAAWSANDVGPMIEKALSPMVRQELLSSWHAPSNKATKTVVDTLVSIASS